jgi:hypothetical protein
MEVMTYILWIVLLMGSVMKNYFVAVSMPRTGQALPAIEFGAESLSYTEFEHVNAVVVPKAVSGILNKQAFSWVDTS